MKNQVFVKGIHQITKTIHHPCYYKDIWSDTNTNIKEIIKNNIPEKEYIHRNNILITIIEWMSLFVVFILVGSYVIVYKSQHNQKFFADAINMDYIDNVDNVDNDCYYLNSSSCFFY